MWHDLTQIRRNRLLEQLGNICPTSCELQVVVFNENKWMETDVRLMGSH